jgi:3-carboxy-cis,cis-muconate cycloisomerase
MSASPFDSALYRDLFGDAEVARLFSDSAEVRAMLLVEGTLARVQGALGLIPAESAAFIDRSAREVQIDPAGLAAETGVNGVPVPALVAAFRRAMEAPAHAAFAHWGATSQDIMDTGLALRLRQVLDLCEARLRGTVQALGALAAAHAETPMAARTYAQAATPTSFGAVVASWGWPLLRHLDRLSELRPRLLQVQLAGAAGTLGAMGPKGPEVRAELARELNLSDPGQSWHSTRDGMAELAGWLTQVATSLGKMGEDLILLSQSGIDEVSIGAGGASSTMPQKQNPVGPSVLSALARQAVALNGAMQGAAIHRQQRDGAAWFTEWLTLPQLCIGTARGLSLAQSLVPQIAPDAATMRAGLEGGLGLIHAEALTFALAETLPRPEAQAAVKALAKQARANATPLPALADAAYPGLGLPARLTPEAQMGTAPAEALAFAEAAKGV